jgi:hypothetical protein
LFRDKDVCIVYDNDTAGRHGADEVNISLRKYAKSLRIVKLPVQEDKEDFTDYIMKYKHTREQFIELCESTPDVIAESKAIIDKIDLPDNTIYSTDLYNSSHMQYYSKMVKVPILVTGKDLTPYMIPKKVMLTCSGGAGKGCAGCELANGGYKMVEFDEFSAEVIPMTSMSDSNLLGVMKHKANLSPKCHGITMKTIEVFNVEEVTVIPEVDWILEDANVESNYVSRTVYYVGHGMKANMTYSFLGRVLVDSRTQHATLLVCEALPSQDSISSFDIEKVKTDLEVFRV